MISFSLKDSILAVLQLSKVKITVAVSFTTITGYVLARGKFDTGFIPVTLGIFMLACGASVLNHIQERKTDALMQRTQNRPLPSGKIRLTGAYMIFLTEVLSGSAILFFAVNNYALILGWLALVWYNLIYTYLKRVTPHAVIPGSVIGAIPPLVGWVAAGGLLIDPRAWSLALFFFMWQVPHFYLLVMKYGDQYESAGLPVLTGRYNNKMIRMIIFLWIVATGFAALLLYYFELVYSLSGLLIVLTASIWIIITFLLSLIRKQSIFNPFRYFMRVNYYVLLVILILLLDRQLVIYII